MPGDSLNGFTDALRRDGSIQWLHVRHEEAAAFAATGPWLAEHLGLPENREPGVLSRRQSR